MLHCAFAVVLRLGLQAARSLTWSHSSAGPPERTSNNCKVRGSSPRGTSRSAMLCKAFLLLLYNMLHLLANSSWAAEAIDYRTSARPTFRLYAFSNIPDHKPDICRKSEGRRCDELNFTSQT